MIEKLTDQPSPLGESLRDAPDNWAVMDKLNEVIDQINKLSFESKVHEKAIYQHGGSISINPIHPDTLMPLEPTQGMRIREERLKQLDSVLFWCELQMKEFISNSDSKHCKEQYEIELQKLKEML